MKNVDDDIWTTLIENSDDEYSVGAGTVGSRQGDLSRN